MSNEAPALSYLAKNWPQLVMVAAGVLLVIVAAGIGQKHNVAHQLTLEATGMRGMATAEPLAANEYRLRLALETAIYSRSYRGELSGGDPDSNAEFSVPVVYDPTDPARFLPSGQSYLPAVLTGVLFLLGMTCVLFARRTAVSVNRMQQLARMRAEEERRRKKKHRHKHHHHGHEHGASNRPV